LSVSGELLFFKAQHIHFIGIGGIGMSGIAEILLSIGPYRITGSDLRRSPVTARLQKLPVLPVGPQFILGATPRTPQRSVVGGWQSILPGRFRKPPRDQCARAGSADVVP
jgi:hypothetical protein